MSATIRESRTVDVAAYIAARVVDDGGCLRWTGAVAAYSHPTMRLPDGKQALIRRLVVEMDSGPIPAGKIVRCTCETPRCVARGCLVVTTFRRVALECGANGLMSGPVRSARIAATKRKGRQAKIGQDDARAIRASDEPGTVLAQRYGISASTVSKIRAGKVRREFAGNPWAALA